jgi:hypothetical protein
MAIKPSGFTIEDGVGDILRFFPEHGDEYGPRVIVEDEGANAMLAIDVSDARALVEFLSNWLKIVGE